jgi:dihydroorotase
MLAGTRITRRQWLQGSAALGVTLPHVSQSGGPTQYDMLVYGGHVVDPASNLSARADIALREGKVARVASGIPTVQARESFDATDCIITPGLVDAHVHVFDGVAPLGIPPDPNCIARGATTVLDGGSAGAHTFPGFRKYVIDLSETRIYALLNIGVTGQATFSNDNPHGELLDLRYVNVEVAVDTIERHRDRILGLKVRLTRNLAGDHDLEVLRRACAAARAVHLPVMVHIGASRSALREILAMLQHGDVITHAFHGHSGGILDEQGRVLAEVHEAVERGISLDIGHGANSFSFATAEKVLDQGLLPHIISSDLHAYNRNGPVYDLATTLSKFMTLGMTLEQVIERATVNPARTFSFPERPGTLTEGAVADIAVFRLSSEPVTFVDSHAAQRPSTNQLRPVATLRAGKLYGSAQL